MPQEPKNVAGFSPKNGTLSLMLIDREIRTALADGEIHISPDDGIDTRIQPASLDVRLGHDFLTLDRQAHPVIDPKQPLTSYKASYIEAGESYTLLPGELVLASTLEEVGLPGDILARVEGKSSLGRIGLLVHATAGYIDPGWARARITLEISTQAGVPTLLWPGMPIAQLAFQRVNKVGAPYSGKYVNQQAPAPSRFHQNWTGSRWI